MFTIRNTHCGLLMAAFAITSLFTGCDAFSGIVPQGDAGDKTEIADHGETSPSQSPGPNRPLDSHRMGMPPSG